MLTNSSGFGIRYVVAFLCAGFLGAGSSSTSFPSLAKVGKYACLTFNGVPTTLAIKVDGEPIPVIRWTSSIPVYSAGLSPERRCKEVSARFDTLNRQGRLKWLTSGRINGDSVICSALRKGLGCDALLFTLKPWQNANSTLRQLARLPMTKEPPHETNGRLYVSIDELLSTPQDPAVEQPGKMESRTFDSPLH